ncbi:hypothetical protein CI109_106340 [Kwoniella shandongensis]|uniref:Steroid 5-alpha reductase C-terminal domain-containing protein n=1 Tax=Kwoniella shandongensis TaxID=1734106 RepID=A0AAJ8N089_9TREE
MVYSSYLDVGVLRDTLLPNLGFHLSLAVPAYLIGRSQNFLQAKDLLWPTGQVLSAWYAAIGRHVIQIPGLGLGLGSGTNATVSLSTAVRAVTTSGWLLLGGATLWGGRLLYREITRDVKRATDDPRYDEIKKEKNGWTKAFFTMFLPEALIQALISLPFTAPFRTSLPVIPSSVDSKGYLQAAAVALFAIGFSLELIGDYQLSEHQAQRKNGLLREGVWSIVRHPNYLGDILIHASFPILLYANNLFNPYVLLGPLTNWFFLRYISGDKQNEASQEVRYAREDPVKSREFEEYKREKNAVWPSFTEVTTNKWSWIVLGVGAAAAVVERSLSVLI